MEKVIYQGDKEVWISRWEPRTKTLAAIIWLIGILLLDDLKVVSAIFISLFLLSIQCFKGLENTLSKLKIVAPLAIFSMITLIFSTGFNVEAQNIHFAVLLSLRVLSSAIIVLMVISTQSFQEYLNSMSAMKLHPVFMTTLFLTSRYTTLIMEEYRKMQNALKARLFKASGNKNTLNTYGNICGGMIVKGIDRSESVYKAMKARGFTGHMPVEEAKTITQQDLIYLTISTLTIISIIFIDWRM